MMQQHTSPPIAQPHRYECLPTFPPAVLFLSITTTTEADRAAGGGEPIKIGLQRATAHLTAPHHGIGIVKEFIEIGAPATTLRRRPVLRRLLAYLKKHPDIRYVIFPGHHRFAQTAEHNHLLLKHFRQLGVGILLAAPTARIRGSLRFQEHTG